MRFSVNLAPGVRLSASSRGLRAHVGPRVARLHVGAGRPGVSTGAGPVSFYAPIGLQHGAPRSSGSKPVGGPRAPGEGGTGRLNAQLQRSAKAEEAETIAEVLEHLRQLHEQTYRPATEPVVAAPTLPAQEQILAAQLAQARRGTSVFNRAKRREADLSARWSAYREIDALWREAQLDYAKRVKAAKSWWERLRSCEPDTVWEQLASAFADNEAAAAPLALNGAHVDLAVLLPPSSAIPSRVPGVTAAGNLSLRKMTKTETASWYGILAAGYILTTADEAFAVAPGLRSATLIGLRPSEALISRSAAECIIVCTLYRHDLNTLDRDQHSLRGLASASSALLTNPDRRTGALNPLDLRDEPDLQAIVDGVDLDDLEREQ